MAGKERDQDKVDGGMRQTEPATGGLDSCLRHGRPAAGAVMRYAAPLWLVE